VGVFLEGDSESVLREIEGVGSSQCYLTRADRVLGCADYLLWHCGFSTARELALEFGVSVNTIYACLNEVERWSAKRGLVLERRSGTGLAVMGNEMLIRQAMVETFWECTDIRFADRKEPDERSVPVKQIWQTLRGVVRSMGLEFSSHALLSLSLHLLVSSHRVKNGNQIALDPSLVAQMKQEQVWPVAKEVTCRCKILLGSEFGDQEQAYIALRLHLAQLAEAARTTPATQNECSDMYSHDAAYLVSAEVGSACGANLKCDTQFVAELSVYLRMSLYRLRYGLHMSNQYLDDVKRYYPFVFQATTCACRRLERIYQVNMTDEEIGWVAIHAAAALQRASTGRGARQTVLVTFANRICVARLLEARLRAEFPTLQILAVVSSEDLDSSVKKLHPDLVVSTDYLDRTPGSVMVVNPLLPPSEVRALSRLVESQPSPRHPRNVRVRVDSAAGKRRGPFFTRGWFGMLRDVTSSDPADILQQGCILLASRHLIGPQYQKAVLENAVGFNACSVVAPGLALPHARPSDGVISDFALAIAPRNPVKFGHKLFDPVSLVILWGARDESSYRDFLDATLDILRDTSLLGRLVSASNPDDMWSTLVRTTPSRQSRQGPHASTDCSPRLDSLPGPSRLSRPSSLT
jgi:transcriptional antiterminator/mannitol/fructose-specific phosphotransferase system IIA component (Ntr-type)